MFAKNYTTVVLLGKLQSGKMASIVLVKIKLKTLLLNKLSISLPKLWIAYEEEARPCDIRSFRHCPYLNSCSSPGALSHYSPIGQEAA